MQLVGSRYGEQVKRLAAVINLGHAGPPLSTLRHAL